MRYFPLDQQVLPLLEPALITDLLFFLKRKWYRLLHVQVNHPTSWQYALTTQMRPVTGALKQPCLSHGVKIVTIIPKKAVSVYENKTQRLIIGCKLHGNTSPEEQTCQCGLKAKYNI